MGIEPTYSAWKAAALPLSYTRVRGRCRTAWAVGHGHVSGHVLCHIRHPARGRRVLNAFAGHGKGRWCKPFIPACIPAGEGRWSPIPRGHSSAPGWGEHIEAAATSSRTGGRGAPLPPRRAPFLARRVRCAPDGTACAPYPRRSEMQQWA